MHRIAGLALAAALLAGCATGVSAPQDRGARCEQLFRDHDRAVRFAPSGAYSERGSRLILRPEFSRLSSQMLQADCATRWYEIADLQALREEILRARPVRDATAIPPATVSVGAVSGLGDEVAVLQFFRSLGFPARSLGAEGVGRRIWIPRLTTQGAVDEALDIARRAGFASPYVADLSPL